MIPRLYYIFLIHCFILLESILCADLVIQIPDNPSKVVGIYRLDYSPSIGNPPPNSTFSTKDLSDSVQFSNGLPGTKYDFQLYFSNSSYNDLLTLTASVVTPPDPPSNISVYARNGEEAIVRWSPPTQGGYSKFKLKIVPLPELPNFMREITVDSSPYSLKGLTPGASYQIQLFTVYEQKESIAYISRNFTTKPNTPGKFIVWFRNETTLLVLWQPPYPAGIFTYYKVSISPADAVESVLYVGNEDENPGPAQAAFKGLVPGRAYNISVQTMSEDEVSVPTTAQYRTVPLRPTNITFDRNTITSQSFKVQWEPPSGKSEFDKYQITVNGLRRLSPVTISRNTPTVLEIREGLEPGRTYQVTVKTMSGKVASWPISANVTLKPFAVTNLRSSRRNDTVMLSWDPNPLSVQDSYKISYYNVETIHSNKDLSRDNGDINSIITQETHAPLESLLPGRNYSITVQAVSNHIESNGTIIYQATNPSSPIIKDLRPTHNGLNISWKSDVNSDQEKYEVTYSRNDTGESVTILTTETLLSLEDLRAGAGYHIKVVAISHGLRSEPHINFQAVYPNPPRNLTIEKVNGNSVIVKWLPPIDSIFTEYSIRTRTEDEKWYKLPPVKQNEAEVTDMIAGEKYIIQVNSVSFGVESTSPSLEVTQTIPPNAVTNVVPIVDSNNVTLEWPKPEGKIEIYSIMWKLEDADPDLDEEEIVNRKTITEDEVHIINGKVAVFIGDLIPGAKYSFEIFTTSHNLKSEVTKLTTRTMPLIASILSFAEETDTLTIIYTKTPRSVSKFNLYRFELSDKNVPVQERSADDTDAKVIFKNLEPGRLYNVSTWTVSDGVASKPLLRQVRLFPEPVSSIRATSIRETEIVLTWDFPKAGNNTFEVQYLNTNDILIQNFSPDNSIAINNLKPHKNYTFSVIVRSGSENSLLRRSSPVSATFSTIESVPEKVDKFEPTDIQPKEITFVWSLSSNRHNGVILKYSITYGLDGSTHTQIQDFNANEHAGVIRNLIPGKTYIFQIQAETRVGYGLANSWKQKMPILAPPKPSSQVVPTEVRKTSTTVQIRFRKNYFSEQNGEIISYAIIVAEDDSKNSTSLDLPSWRDVQAYNVWPPYQVTEPYNPFKNSSVENFTIGTENCSEKFGYCNGPLKPGASYKVKIRAFTAPDKFTDTYYGFPIQTDTDNTALIVGLTLPLVILFLLVLIVLAVRRKRVGTCKGNGLETRGNDTLSLPDSVIEISRPVKLKEFAEHYRIMSADSDFRFSEEFEELKHVGRDQACTAADLPVNRPKNRFTNILPYDHSRFKLQPADDDEDGSDYINANYVPGFNSPREFIVTQGPLHSTRDDFWRTCWESNSRAIVMLTRCVEKGREKCDHYWPYDTQPVYYGDIQVTILNESHYPDWNVSELRISRGDTTRIIRHFHFTTWPDFGVPDPPQTLVRFVRAFRERVGPEQRPIVLHCSAGVGRSGTFIALDRILLQIKQEDTVDIFGIVYAMRKERVWMVQTEQQYICIHQCLLAVLEGKENELGPREIHDNEGFDDDEGIAESGM